MRINHFFVWFLLGVCAHLQAQEGKDSGVNHITQEQFDTLMTEYSNWGRWGDDDQLGTLNLITLERKVKAAKLVKEGTSFSLARDLDKSIGSHNPSPFELKMFMYPGGAADVFTINYHGLNTTHVDGLAHFTYKGKLYNGFPSSVLRAGGAEKLGVEKMAQGVFTRGVLIDMAAHKGVPYLAHDELIYYQDLVDWEKKSGIKIQSGDAVLLRTGSWARIEKKGYNLTFPMGGLHASTVKWFAEKDIAVFGTDNGGDAYLTGLKTIHAHVHLFLLVAKGAPMFDNLDLELLGQHVKQTGRHTFLFTVAPLRAPGGTGSPINPIAVF